MLRLEKIEVIKPYNLGNKQLCFLTSVHIKKLTILICKKKQAEGSPSA